LSACRIRIWGFYLYRRGVCRAAQPNAGHLALAGLERALRERGEVERTAGATDLSSLIVQRSHERRVPLLLINRDPSPFSELAQLSPTGLFCQGASGELLPGLCELLADAQL
jgi:hypothetical protein